MFQKAERVKKKLRMIISGVSGAGKTYSSLAIAEELAKGAQKVHLDGDLPENDSAIALIDTEHQSSSLYSDFFTFHSCQLGEERHHPDHYIEAIRYAGKAGYSVIVIDSLSHAWFKMLEMAGNNFNNWKNVNVHERNLIGAMLSSPAHIIATTRSKSDFVDGVGPNGKPTKVKQGMKAVMRDGIEYEFDIASTMDLDNTLTFEKSRCPALTNTSWHKPGAELAEQLKLWLAEGSEAVIQSVNEFKSAQDLQPSLFKEAYTSVGMSREDAIAILKRFDVDHPKFLSPQQFQDCINLIKESAA